MTGNTERHACVVIATRNRREDARRAIASALMQRPPVDVLVVDDASEDGTGDMVWSEFPSVRLLRSKRRLGCAQARNWGVQAAGTPVVMLIDDDAYFTDPGTVAASVRDFDHPRIGAVAVPFVEGGRWGKLAPAEGDGTHATDSFIGASFAVRRDVFMRVGGFRPSLVIYTEESDLCLRMLAAGYVTRAGTAPPLVHEPNPARDVQARLVRRWRNEVMFKWRHTPAVYLPAALAAQVASMAREARRRGRCWGALGRGLAGGARGILAGVSERKPVGVGVYRVWRELRRRGLAPLEAIQDRLPPATLAPRLTLNVDPEVGLEASLETV